MPLARSVSFPHLRNGVDYGISTSETTRVLAPGGAGQAGLRLTSNAAGNFAMLVNVDAISASFLRVLPGDAQNAYLVIKLEGRQSVGERMPQSAPALDNIDLTNIKNWINNGAPNN